MLSPVLILLELSIIRGLWNGQYKRGGLLKPAEFEIYGRKKSSEHSHFVNFPITFWSNGR